LPGAPGEKKKESRVAARGFGFFLFHRFLIHHAGQRLKSLLQAERRNSTSVCTADPGIPQAGNKGEQVIDRAFLQATVQLHHHSKAMVSAARTRCEVLRHKGLSALFRDLLVPA
jgi:hypothetical protein